MQQVFEAGGSHHTFRVGGPPAFFQILLVEPDAMAGLLGREPPHLLPISADPRLQAKLRRACSIVRFGADPLSMELAVADYVRDLFATLGEQHPPAEPAQCHDWRVSRVHEMIHDGYRSELCLSKLAGAVGLSPARLVTIFRERTSLPVHQ